MPTKSRFGRGIKATERVDWNAQPLGRISDYRLARLLGVSQTAVQSARTRRGIAPHRDTAGHSAAWTWSFGESCAVRNLEAGAF